MDVASRLKDASRYRVDLADDLAVVCRVVSVDQLMSRGVIPPALLLGGEAPSVMTFVTDDGGLEKRINATIEAGLVDPPIWTGEPEKCPDSHVLMEHVAPYRLALFNAILAHSGLTAEVSHAASFPGAAEDGGDGGGDGEGGGGVPV